MLGIIKYNNAKYVSEQGPQLWFFFILLSLFILSLWMQLQRSLDRLNRGVTIGSLMFTLNFRLKLVGSRINCVRVFGLFRISWKFSSLLATRQSSDISSIILFLVILYAGQIATIWQIDSDSVRHKRQIGFPFPVSSNLRLYVR